MFAEALAAALTLATAAEPHPAYSPGAEAPPDAIVKACAGKDGWSDPAPPARIFGNTYIVGTCGITALLVVTDKGLILIDGATAEAAPGIARNIEALGFVPGDVRYLLTSHEHHDHVGGLAELKRLTRAKLLVRAEAKASYESGQPSATDPQRGAIEPFKGIEVDRALRDGARVRLGGITLTAIATPGHTPGGTSWSWRSCEEQVCRTIVYADSLSAVSAEAYRFSAHPDYVKTLRRTIARVGALRCDIVITPHPSASNLFERLAGRAPLIDRGGCRAYAAAASARLETRLASERAR